MSERDSVIHLVAGGWVEKPRVLEVFLQMHLRNMQEIYMKSVISWNQNASLVTFRALYNLHQRALTSYFSFRSNTIVAASVSQNLFLELVERLAHSLAYFLSAQLCEDCKKDTRRKQAIKSGLFMFTFLRRDSRVHLTLIHISLKLWRDIFRDFVRFAKHSETNCWSDPPGIGQWSNISSVFN